MRPEGRAAGCKIPSCFGTPCAAIQRRRAVFFRGIAVSYTHLDVYKRQLIYFGVQKNVAPAGMAVVIVREDLIGRARPDTPAMLDLSLIHI